MTNKKAAINDRKDHPNLINTKAQKDLFDELIS